jgi:hypothetical protein
MPSLSSTLQNYVLIIDCVDITFELCGCWQCAVCWWGSAQAWQGCQVYHHLQQVSHNSLHMYNIAEPDSFTLIRIPVNVKEICHRNQWVEVLRIYKMFFMSVTKYLLNKSTFLQRSIWIQNRKGLPTYFYRIRIQSEQFNRICKGYD